MVLRSSHYTAVILACTVTFALAGCSEPARKPAASTAPARGAAVGDSVAVGEGLSAMLVSVDASAPPQGWTPGEKETSATWLEFVVLNTGEASATLPSRPLRPSITDANGVRVEVAAITAGLKNGGGGWGPAAAHRGAPYLNPGGSMVVHCGVATLQGVERPITIRYSPTRDGTATFVVW